MNIDSVYFKQKKDIVNSINAFNELEKVRLNYVPKKKVLILNQSNISPDMMNTIRNNNAYEDEFGRNHNKYKNTPHIDSIPKYTPPYYAPGETGYGSFNYESFVQNLKMV
jgi:hypothetical protein